MKRTTLVIALWAVFVATAFAQKAGNEQQLAKEANEYFHSGDFLKAYPLYSQLVSLYPQNADYSYRFGACAIYSDPDKSKAIKFLASATKRNVSDPMAWYYLGKAYHLNYQFREAVKSYEEFITKADPKIAAKYNAQREVETCIYGSNLLSNIKDLVVLDKVEADRNNFFRYMDLDGIGGKILTVPAELQTKLDQKSAVPGVIHYPGNSTTIYFSSYGQDGTTGKDIYKAQILPDGKFSKPEKVKGDVNTKYDEDYCFLHSDGKTLYFASKGHNSMGGYDIFKSVMDPTTGVFGPAVNLDFAINTPDDDIFYVADSLNQKAYFASGRSSDQNHLHVYNVMVQGIPLRIVYLKGTFSSEIDTEQKNATIQVRDIHTGRVVMENSTQPESGSYTLYVPKAGEYKYFVKTENSPVIHEAEVTIPPFDKPVALKQELKLVKENGRDKLIVTNYFNEILNEDIAALAAEMLRNKAGLNVSDIPASSAAKPKEELALSVEKNMENVALAAGFGNEVTVQSVLSDMMNDAKKAEAFVSSSDTRINAAYQFARDKEAKASELTRQAEQINTTLSGYTSPEDIEKLRQSQKLLNEAQTLKREAASAIMAAQAIQEEKLRTKSDLDALHTNLTALEKGFSAGDFDPTLIALQREKDRIVAGRQSKDDGVTTMYKAAKQKEDDLHHSEDKLSHLRQSEKEKQKEIEALEQKKANAKKKNEIAEIETALVNAKSDLDGIRRGIRDRILTTEKLGRETRDAYAAVDVYQKLLGDEKLGYSEIKPLDDAQRNAISMRVDALDTRFEKLIITDPQTLALITDSESDESLTSTVNVNVTATNRGQNIPREMGGNTIGIDEEKNRTSTPLENSPASTESNTKPASAIISAEPAPVAIKAEYDNSFRKIESIAPANDGAKRMVMTQSILSADARIEEIQRKRSTGITVEEKKELQDLIAYRDELKTKLPVNPKIKTFGNENAKATATSVDPEYAGKMADIENMPVTELEKTKERTAYQRNTIAKLNEARGRNVQKIGESSSAQEIAELTTRDQELEAAIAYLQHATSGVDTYKAAFDLENKEILNEQNQLKRLESQVELTQDYMNTLESLEADFQEKLALSTDLKESESIRMSIGEIKKEYQIAQGRLTGYQSDLRLTASTAEPTAQDSALTAPSTLEEELEGDLSENREESTETPEEKTETEKIKEDVREIRSIMKPRTESESIFAYESNEYQSLVNHHPELSAKLKDQDKINAVQSEILLIEAEVETETRARRQKKLDREAEKLYHRKSVMELKNTGIIQEMTQAEYYKLIGEIEQLNTENQEDLNSRTMLRDEVQKLYNQASSNFEEAKSLREKSTPVNDPIEKNDYYRQAFAKEALAIQQLNQIVEIHENMNLLLEYDDRELAEMRYGNPDNIRTSESTASTDTEDQVYTPTEELPGVEMAIDSKQVVSDGDPNIITVIAPERSNREETAEPASANPDSGAVISPAPAASRAAAGYYGDAEAGSYYFSFPSELNKNLFVRTRSAVYTNNTPIPVNPEMPKGVYYSVQIGAFRNPIPQNLYDEFAPIIGDRLNNGITRYIAGFFLTFENADEVKMEIRRMGYSDAFVVAYRDGKRIPLYEAMGKTEPDALASMEKEYVYGDKGNAPVKSESMNGNVSGNNATSVSNGRADTTPGSAAATPGKRIDYYSGVKDAVPATQVETVKGLFFTVQVGVYSKPVPAANIKNIQPVNSELTANSKIRYTSGIYKSLDEAVNQRNAAKQLGISDAFITAYFNGERITLSEADRLLRESGPSILVK